MYVFPHIFAGLYYPLGLQESGAAYMLKVLSTESQAHVAFIHSTVC